MTMNMDKNLIPKVRGKSMGERQNKTSKEPIRTYKVSMTGYTLTKYKLFFVMK